MLLVRLTRIIHHCRGASLDIRHHSAFASLTNTGSIRSVAENTVITTTFAIRSLSGELSRLTTLALCISLASCDQYVSIAVVDASTTSTSDSPPSEPPDKSSVSDAGVDAAFIPSNPPIGGNDEGSSDAGTDAGTPSAGVDAAFIPSNPPIAGNADASDSGACPDRPFVEGCDPTKEGTCEGVLQCVVDQTVPNLKGICVFYTPLDIVCFGSFATESCPPTFMCWGGSCRELCLCDADCSTGGCYGEAVGAAGFRMCAD